MNIAIILAGGTGKRMGAGVPKQFIEIDGKPLVAHTLEVFQKCPLIDGILVVSDRGSVSRYDDVRDRYGITKLLSVVCGGRDRARSSYNGVKAAKKLFDKNGSRFPAENIVLIHDAARPFVTESVIEENLRLVREHGACETVIPNNDTLVKGIDGFNAGSISRENVFRVQTPQTFRFDVITSAFDNYDFDCGDPVTDDAELIRRNGGKVALAKGSPLNVKITSPEDLDFFRIDRSLKRPEDMPADRLRANTREANAESPF
ncbi:MAG: 2-C-methyl-D-erythritol 4-phosphate cytidylyltransferase [Clostridia bacterium]|nr:2-C-methyl-D-erythritol 4-phosphate cytidylyltransferase [Clostridia bacterium]